MTYNYCPNCGLDQKKHPPRQGGAPACTYCDYIFHKKPEDVKPILKPNPTIAEMVESIEAIDKIATRVLVRHGCYEVLRESRPGHAKADRIAELRAEYDLHYAWEKKGYSPMWLHAVAVINELLDMLGAKDKPGKYDYLEIMGELIKEVERLKSMRSHTIRKPRKGEPLIDPYLSGLRKVYNKYTSNDEATVVINELLDEIKRLKAV